MQMRQNNQNTCMPPAEPQDPAHSLFLVKLAVSPNKRKLYGKIRKLVSKFTAVFLLIAVGRS